MIDDIAIRPNQNAITLAGQAANKAAARHVFDDYRARRATNTLHRPRLTWHGRRTHGAA